MEANQLLGLDVGLKRTGIARASSVAKIAQPLFSVETDHLMEKLRELMKELGASVIVVGLPRNLSGEDTGQTKWVRDWVVKAKKHIDAAFYWQDEALTTKTAELSEQSSKKPVDIDAAAAGIILQDFLDSPETERVMC